MVRPISNGGGESAAAATGDGPQGAAAGYGGARGATASAGGPAAAGDGARGAAAGDGGARRASGISAPARRPAGARNASADEFGGVTRDALPDQIAAKLIELVRDRRLRSGDRLPPERELAAAMGVSRSSLREALRALSMIGVIDMRHGDGTYLSSLEPASLMRPVGLVLELSESGMEELFEARKVVEPGLAALAAERIDEPTLIALQHCVEQSEHSVGDHEQFMQADLELHDLIARAAGNAILCRLIDSIHSLGIASRRTTSAIPGVEARTVADHREIVNALAARDPERAHHAMLTHLENVERARTT